MRFILIQLTLSLLSISLYGQSKSATEPFPTYGQIKPVSSEIVDYVPQPGTSGINRRQIPFNLFDYPDKTVRYYLNGKPTTDSRYVEELMHRKEINITNMTIEQPTQDGKRTIRIDYSTNK